MEILRKTKEKLDAVKEGLLLALAMCFMMFIYAPLEIYSYNQNEFWYDIYDLLPMFLILFVGVFLVLAVMAVLVYSVSRRIYNVIFVAGTIGYISTYIQGTFMVKNLPRMDGTVANWAEYSKERMYSLILWIVVTLVACVIVKRVSCGKYVKVAGTVALCMTLMLLLTMCSFVITTKSYRGKVNSIATKKTLFEMSEDTNFIIFVLDSVDSKTLYDMIETDVRYQGNFEDFTYYPNTIGSYPYTIYALPYILTGEYYKNDESFDDYNIRAYQSSELLNNLKKQGYNINVFADSGVLPKYGANLFAFDNHHNEFRISSYTQFAKLQLKLVGLRYAPYQLKEKCMISTEQLDDLMVLEGDETVFSENIIDFNHAIQTRRVTYTEEPCFKYIHLEGAHLPFRYDENLNDIGCSTYAQCVRASVTVTSAYLAMLKDAQVYDNSVIIIMSDHGYDQVQVLDNAYGRQNPILFVKGVGEDHPLEISDAPISFEDLQEAYKRLMEGCPSTDAFDYQEGDQRERRYMYYFYGEEEYIYEYMHEDHAFIDNMHPTGVEYFLNE